MGSPPPENQAYNEPQLQIRACENRARDLVPPADGVAAFENIPGYDTERTAQRRLCALPGPKTHRTPNH